MLHNFSSCRFIQVCQLLFKENPPTPPKNHQHLFTHLVSCAHQPVFAQQAHSPPTPLTKTKTKLQTKTQDPPPPTTPPPPPSQVIVASKLFSYHLIWTSAGSGANTACLSGQNLVHHYLCFFGGSLLWVHSSCCLRSKLIQPGVRRPQAFTTPHHQNAGPTCPAQIDPSALFSACRRLGSPDWKNTKRKGTSVMGCKLREAS